MPFEHLSLQVNREGDAWTLVGAADMGETCNTMDILSKGKKQVRLATHILQFAFIGFTGFRWPVAYYSSTTATASELYITVHEVIEALDDFGFTTDYVMMDGASTNRSLTKMVLGGGGIRPYSDSNVHTKNIFNHDENIVFTQDIKHVFKKLRNGIESSRLKNMSEKGRCLRYGDKYIVWDHWESAFKFNTHGGFRIYRKLTKDHIEVTSISKMRNNLATDVLNADMLHLMKKYSETLPDEEQQKLTSSILLLQHTSVLVDLFLDTQRPITSMADKRIDFARKALDFFNRWEEEVIELKLNTSKHLLTAETRDDLNLAVMGFFAVAEKVVGKSRTLRAGYFNSDLIENVFCQQRGMKHGCCTNPTVSQYGPAINAIVLGQMGISRKSNAGTKALHFGATTDRPLARHSRKRKPGEQSGRPKKIRV